VDTDDEEEEEKQISSCICWLKEND